MMKPMVGSSGQECGVVGSGGEYSSTCSLAGQVRGWAAGTWVSLGPQVSHREGKVRPGVEKLAEPPRGPAALAGWG